LNNLISDHVIPIKGKVTELILKRQKAKWRIIKISIRQEQNKTCIQKQRVEDKSHYRHCYLTFVVVADLLEQEDIDESQYSV